MCLICALLLKNALPCALRCALLLMPGGVGGAVQAARFAGGLGAACYVLGSVRRGGFPITRTGAACTGLTAGA